MNKLLIFLLTFDIGLVPVLAKTFEDNTGMNIPVYLSWYTHFSWVRSRVLRHRKAYVQV